MNGASKLYVYWTIAQLTTALYSYTVITFFGVWGLSTIPLINLLLLSGISVWVAGKKGISIKEMFARNFFKKIANFIIPVILATLIIYFIPLYYSLIIELIYRTLLVVLLFILILVIAFKKELYSFLRSNKIRFSYCKKKAPE